MPKFAENELILATDGKGRKVVIDCNGEYAVTLNKRCLAKALAEAKGTWQTGLLNGHYAISCGDLRGAAKQFTRRYKESAHNLFVRIRRSGVPITVVSVGSASRSVIVIGAESADYLRKSEQAAFRRRRSIRFAVGAFARGWITGEPTGEGGARLRGFARDYQIGITRFDDLIMRARFAKT